MFINKAFLCSYNVNTVEPFEVLNQIIFFLIFWGGLLTRGRKVFFIRGEKDLIVMTNFLFFLLVLTIYLKLNEVYGVHIYQARYA